ncbi:hypothetical protein ABZX51_003566 [Aspergillus tubingensis]
MLRSLVALGFTIGLLAMPGAAVTVDNAFNIYTGTGTGSCASRLSKLEDFWMDTNTLASGLATAFDTADDKDATRDRVVAQKLFTAWLGIKFDNSGDTPAIKDKSSQTSMSAFEQNSDVLNKFVASGEYSSYKSPPRLFCDNFGDWFDWTDQAFDASGNPVELNGVALTIEEMYEQVRQQAGYDSHRPYWISDMGVYVFPKPTSNGDLCGASANGNPLQGVSIPGYPEGYYQATVNGETEIIEYKAMEDIVLLCPDSFDSQIPWEYDILASLPEVEAEDGEYLYDAMPRSSTLFHELWHLVTFWLGLDKKIDQPITGRLTDHSYYTEQCLALAAGWYTNIYADQNVENYVFLAMSWWYWVEENVAFYDGEPHAWDWVPEEGEDDDDGDDDDEED